MPSAVMLDSGRCPALDAVMTTLVRPQSLDAALDALATQPERFRILAGGTDILPVDVTRKAWFQPAGETLLDMSSIDLRSIARKDGEIRFGALATWSDIIATPLPKAFDGLKVAARQVGGAQIQNRGTIGGNLCNASPAADGVPPLLALDAEVELASRRGTRRLALSDFILGNRRTARRPDEILTAVVVPEPESKARSVFLKLGARRYLVISIASVAVTMRFNPDRTIDRACVAVGACSAAPVRLRRLEEKLAGARLADARAELTPDDGLAPIDDVRASASYRLAAAETLVNRALRQLAASDGSEP
jgi:CO/xanthine dehydrogenase FAD-binding subunit